MVIMTSPFAQPERFIISQEEVPMRAYLVQHGKARPVEEDPNRGLTEEGRTEAAQIGQFLGGLRLSVSLIQHSGKTRAEQTAHILAGYMRCTAGPCHTDGLSPSDDPAMTANFLKVYTDDILLVGHLPHLERLTSLLLTGSPDARPVLFRNAGVVCLEKNPNGTWSLLWAVVPEMVRTRLD
jgi:phosphohistidine phosphatase